MVVNCNICLLTTIRKILLTLVKWSSLQKMVSKYVQKYFFNPWGQSYETFYCNNLLPLYGIAVNLYYKTITNYNRILVNFCNLQQYVNCMKSRVKIMTVIFHGPKYHKLDASVYFFNSSIISRCCDSPQSLGLRYF
jgi:hypothetical protein